MNDKNANLKSLLYQDKPIYYVYTPEGNHIVIRPLCDLLGLDAKWQIKSIQDDEILGDEGCEHTLHLPGDDRNRKWICLPEEFIYGWLFSVKMTNTMSDATKQNLIGYKRGCYHALYEHFHGRIKQAQQAISKKAANEAEIISLRKQQEDATPEIHARIQFLLTENKQIGNPLARIQNSQYQLDLSKALGEDQMEE